MVLAWTGLRQPGFARRVASSPVEGGPEAVFVTMNHNRAPAHATVSFFRPDQVDTTRLVAHSYGWCIIRVMRGWYATAYGCATNARRLGRTCTALSDGGLASDVTECESEARAPSRVSVSKMSSSLSSTTVVMKDGVRATDWEHSF